MMEGLRYFHLINETDLEISLWQRSHQLWVRPINIVYTLTQGNLLHDMLYELFKKGALLLVINQCFKL